MRELERDLPANATHAAPAAPERLLIVGPGRAGRSIADAARAAGIAADLAGRTDHLEALLRRDGDTSAAVLLCVPDAEITAACARVAPLAPRGTAVGHVSGAADLEVLRPARAAALATFSMHPLQTIPGPGTDLTGAPCAVAGSDESVLALATALVARLGMRPFRVPDEARAAYHAAAAIASNFLVALEESASELLAAAGVEDARETLAPLVLRTAANWADHGGEALTGPIARGDEATVARHIDALEKHAPHLLGLYEALAEHTRRLADAVRESR